MNITLSDDLPVMVVVGACLLAGLSFAFLILEVRRMSERRPWLVWLSGMLATVALLLAVLRPARVAQTSAGLGARVTFLFDVSRSMDLESTGEGRTRRERAAALFPQLRAHFGGARQTNLYFGRGPARALGDSSIQGLRPAAESDLIAALRSVAGATEAVPQAVVLVSDGRFDRPVGEGLTTELDSALGALHAPIHTVMLGGEAVADAAIADVRFAGAVVAHQPVVITVEVACTGGLPCGEIPVFLREIHAAGKPVERASGTVALKEGRGAIDLELVLDRAGQRIVEVAIEPPEGDLVAGNNRRLLPISVARDQVRLLHVAGRPTYDVRALRRWLKADASVDVVAFFILRTHSDDVAASNDELSLIPFPVDELFTSHLPSFDAVILQDFDARPYGLSKHLRSLRRYVEQGGGVIMIGGPNAFVSGSYAATPLAEVLPVDMRGVRRDKAVDFASFAPRLTAAGRSAPVLEPLRALIGDDFPDMPGCNVVAGVRPGATVLLEHPNRQIGAGKAMPILALGEYKSGRSIALTVDGSHRLLFSRFAAGAAGRAHGAFFDALLGWLMRDPRFEPLLLAVAGECFAGVPAQLRVRSVFGGDGVPMQLEVTPLTSGGEPTRREVVVPKGKDAVTVEVGALAEGAYSAVLRRAQHAIPARLDFACEMGGREWADSRPDAARLRQIAAHTSGVAVGPDGVDRLPLPRAVDVIAQRHVHPLLPAWSWSLFAAMLLGAHWWSRRHGGLS